jgi:hypothetical protein
MTQWSWRPDGPGTSLRGEFGSRDEAIADAREYYGPDEPARVLVGILCPLEPAECVSGDVDWLLEAMDEAAEIDVDDQIFYAAPGAQQALDAALKNWARKYVFTDIEHVTRDEEEIVLGGEEEP